MKVLVAVASKYDATTGIAEAIAQRLRARGLVVDLRRLGRDDAAAAGYDAFILGSGVYAGHWLKEATHFVDDHAADLVARPVWLFSSGPVGDPPKPADDSAVLVDDLVARTNARAHRLFAGRLERARLSLVERALVAALRAPEGDFRDWGAIRAFADEIADALAAGGSAAP